MKQYNILGGVDEMKIDNNTGECIRINKPHEVCEICETECKASVCENCIDEWEELTFGWTKPDKGQLELFET